MLKAIARLIALLFGHTLLFKSDFTDAGISELTPGDWIMLFNCGKRGALVVGPMEHENAQSTCETYCNELWVVDWFPNGNCYWLSAEKYNKIPDAT